MPNLSELQACGIDRFDRPLARHTKTKLYYCVLNPGETYHDVLAGKADLYLKGMDREDEPSHPVTLVDDRD